MSAIESEELLELTDKFVDGWENTLNRKNCIYVMDAERFKFAVQLLIKKIEK